MKNRGIVPLTELGERPPEAGRIRLGVKTARAMKSIDTIRLTSPWRDVIDAAAALWGGTAKPWHEERASPKDQFEVITTVNEIPVYVVPDGLSVWYEQWSGGGCTRRCDGVDCATFRSVGGDYESVSVPCLCIRENLRSCDPHTRMSMILPDLPFRGVWRCETKGWNAAVELPGMFRVVEQLSQGGMVRARFGVERRQEAKAGQRRDFVVPRLSIEQSVLELQAGGSNALALTAAPQGELSRTSLVAPAGELAAPVVDDGIVDAEEISEVEADADRRCREDAEQFGLNPARYADAIRHTAARTPEGVELSSEEVGRKMREVSDKVRAELFEPLGFKADGSVHWRSIKQRSET